MRIPLLRGRLFGPADSATSLPVAVVDDVLAKTYFGADDPIGKRIDFEGDAEHRSWRTVVGVVRTIKAHSLDDSPRPAIYAPFAQSHEPILTLVARVEGSPGGFARVVRQAVAAVDADQPLGAVLPLEELLSESVAQRRLSASALTGFAAVAVLLAAIGLYGALAYSVTQRRREIGVRMALGALPSSVIRLVLRESGKMIGAGIAGGLVAAALLTRFLASLLYEVAPVDLAVYTFVVAVLAGVGLAASLLPAARAARIEPSVVLRGE